MSETKLKQEQITGTTLGYAQITSNFTSTTTPAKVDVTGLTTTVTIPAGGRRIKATAFTRQGYSSGASTYYTMSILEDGTVIGDNIQRSIASGADEKGLIVLCSKIPTAGSHTYKVQIEQSGAGTMVVGATATSPAFIMVELA